MRVSTRMLQGGTLQHIQNNYSEIARVSQTVASGKKLLRPSDDPTGAADSMRTRSNLRVIEQYRASIDFANQRASMEETVLSDLTDILMRAKEIAITQSQPATTAATRLASRREVEQLLRHGVSLANTRFGDDYLFASMDAVTPPYDVDETGPTLSFTTTSPGGAHMVKISVNQEIRTNRNGVEVFENSNALGVLRDLAAALNTADPENVRNLLDDLDTSIGNVQDLIGDTGARQNQMRIATANYDAMELHLLKFKSDVEDAEMEQAMTELAGRQTSLQAAMLATSRVMGLTLAQYMR